MSFIIIHVLMAIISFVSAGDNKEQEQLSNRLVFGKLDQCQGPDSSNYTYVSIEENRQTIRYLISCSPTGEKNVISLQDLARSNYPAGAYSQFEILMLATSGSLAGKYIYFKFIFQVQSYLKKYSSVLGYSYGLSKRVILIADKLDVNMFTYPGGAYEPFKNASSTVCQGQAYNF